LTRDELIKEGLSIAINDNPKAIEEMKGKLSDYLDKNGSDPQIRDVIRVLETYLEEYKNSDFEMCCEIAEPIFDRLSNPSNWDFYDIVILHMVVDYAGTYSQTYEIAENILKKLEEHKHRKTYKNIKIWTFLNSMLRMLRAKYFEMDDLVIPEDLDKKFSNYFDIFMEISNDREFDVLREIARIRKGLFYNDVELTNRGFERLKKLRVKDVYKMMEKDVQEFGFLTDARKSKNQLLITIGQNLHKLRTEANMSVKDLAKVIGRAPHYISNVEAGKQVASPNTLTTLGDFFGVATSYFRGTGNGGDDAVEKERALIIADINSRIQNFSQENLKYIHNMVKGFPANKD